MGEWPAVPNEEPWGLFGKKQKKTFFWLTPSITSSILESQIVPTGDFSRRLDVEDGAVGPGQRKPQKPYVRKRQAEKQQSNRNARHLPNASHEKKRTSREAWRPERAEKPKTSLLTSRPVLSGCQCERQK